MLAYLTEGIETGTYSLSGQAVMMSSGLSLHQPAIIL
jgi:hypothetical protein